jgi:hypothetical protein
VRGSVTVKSVAPPDFPRSSNPSPEKLPPASFGIKFLAVLGVFAWAGFVWWVLDLIAPGWPHRHLEVWAPFAAAAYWGLVELVIARRYGADVMAGQSRAARARLRRWIFGYILPPIVAFVMLVAGLGGFLPEWSVTHGGGTPGTLTLTRQACSHPDCHWYGEFVADDNSVRYSGVRMWDGVRGGTVGAKVRVRLSHETGDAYAETGSTAWVASGMVTLTCALYLLGAAIWLSWRVLRHRQSPSRTSPR